MLGRINLRESCFFILIVKNVAYRINGPKTCKAGISCPLMHLPKEL